MAEDGVSEAVMLGSGHLTVLDTHIHLNASLSGGLHNEWVAGADTPEGFKRDWVRDPLGTGHNIVASATAPCSWGTRVHKTQASQMWCTP
jgi:hypothetical protein